MGGVVVQIDVDDLAYRDLRLDSVVEADELLMPMTLHAATDDFTLKHFESREKRGRAMALVVMVPARPFLIGSPGWVRSKAWISDF